MLLDRPHQPAARTNVFHQAPNLRPPTRIFPRSLCCQTCMPVSNCVSLCMALSREYALLAKLCSFVDAWPHGPTLTGLNRTWISGATPYPDFRASLLPHSAVCEGLPAGREALLPQPRPPHPTPQPSNNSAAMCGPGGRHSTATARRPWMLNQQSDSCRPGTCNGV